jgi:hypothetical protein
MDATAIAAVLTGPFGLAAVALWFAFTKDRQCSALMARIEALAVQQATVNQAAIASIDALRDAIRQGTRP